MNAAPPLCWDTDVLIVGAGPTGLTAAARLAQSGVPFMLVDAAAGPTTQSKAALVHASTIAIFERLRLADDLVSAGRRVDNITVADGRKRLAQVGFGQLPGKYTFALGVPQNVTEELLITRLNALGHSVYRNVQITSLKSEADGHIAHGSLGDVGAGVHIRARFVIGADGSNSTIRTAIGQEFLGSTYAEDFVLADIELFPPPCPDNEARITLSPRGVTVVGRLPSGRYRVIATATKGATTPESPSRAYIEHLLKERDVPTATGADPVWSSRFRISHRAARSFRSGHVFIAGDAAHVHSPAAGQGMNTGIADGYDIADRLAGVIADGQDEGVLDGYDSARRAAALEVLAFTDRVTKMALLRNGAARRLRNAAIRVGSRFPPAQRAMVMWISGLKRSPLAEDQTQHSPR